MYCPTCGKDNVDTARFCRACGRNLAGLLSEIKPDEGSAFARFEHRTDEIIAHYASRFFKGSVAPPPTTRSLKEQWKLLGKGFLSVLADLVYTWIIVEFVLTIRFWILLFKSPFQWWRIRKARQVVQLPIVQPVPVLPEPGSSKMPVASVTEETTTRLSDYSPRPRERA